jgi:hypothetical protein
MSENYSSPAYPVQSAAEFQAHGLTKIEYARIHLMAGLLANAGLVDEMTENPEVVTGLLDSLVRDIFNSPPPGEVGKGSEAP